MIRSKKLSGAILGLVLVGCAIGLWGGGAFQEQTLGASNHFDGSVISRTGASLMIQASPDSDIVAFRVESNAPITKDGERVTLERLGEGDIVAIDFQMKNDQRIATNIVARSQL